MAAIVCMCIRAYAQTTGLWLWSTCGGQELLTWMRGRVIYHLQKRDQEGLELKARERREEVAGSSLHHSRCLLFSLSTSWQLTTQQTPTSDLLRLVSLHRPIPPLTGPPETFVPFISTTNTYRCSWKEEAERQRICKHMLPPLNDCWFGDNLLLCKQTACWGAHAKSGFIIQCKHGQLSF